MQKFNWLLHRLPTSDKYPCRHKHQLS